MKSTLKIAPNLSLPIEAVTQTFGILGKRGGGKSYTAKVMAEEMIKADAHVCAVDPIGNWWGLRAGADGKSPGLPITVLGGEYGDIPLEPGEKAGELVARLIIEERISAVIDLSLFRKGEQTSFMIGWAEALYRLNREALHLFIDEADAWAPQRPVGNLAPRLLGAMEDLVRRGRARGLGMTMITQRSASINKDLLTQIEVLIAKRTIAPQDRDAIEAWIEVHGTPAQQKILMESLPSLPKEDAWIWSPGWLDLFQRVKIRKLETFDSSSTPEVGKKRIHPRKLAEADLERLRERMSATIEKAKADDPRELRKQVAELGRELSKKSVEIEAALAKKVAAAAPARRVEVSILKDAHVKAIQTAAEKLGKLFGDALEKINAALAISRTAPVAPRAPASPTPHNPPQAGAAKPVRPVNAGLAAQNSPTRPQQAILDGLSWLEAIGIARATRTIVAFLAEASPRSSAYVNNLGALRTAGLIEYPSQGEVAMTEAGRAISAAIAAPPTSEHLHEMIYARLPRPQSSILKALIHVYPEALDREQLASLAGASPKSSAYVNNLGALRSIGLIDYPDRGHVVARELLFLEAK